jgi:hypothetical protein
MAPAAQAAVVIALAQFGRLLVIAAGAHLDQFEREHVVALVVAVLTRRAGGDRRIEQVIDRLALLLHVAGESPHVLGHEQLVGPQAGVAEAGIDEPPVDRLEDLRFEDAAVDRLVDLLLEIADVLGALVLDAHEADPSRRWGQRFGPLFVGHLLHGGIDVPGEQLGDGVVDQRGERLLARLVAADHGVFAGHHHAGELHAPTAAREGSQGHCREPTNEECATVRSIRVAHVAAPFA